MLFFLPDLSLSLHAWLYNIIVAFVMSARSQDFVVFLGSLKLFELPVVRMPPSTEVTGSLAPPDENLFGEVLLVLNPSFRF